MEHAVQADRRSHVESVMIKVMKRLKRCDFETMVSEVVPLLRFGQKRADVEARIDNLIKRGNLEVWEETIPEEEKKKEEEEAEEKM